MIPVEEYFVSCDDWGSCVRYYNFNEWVKKVQNLTTAHNYELVDIYMTDPTEYVDSYYIEAILKVKENDL